MHFALASSENNVAELGAGRCIQRLDVILGILLPGLLFQGFEVIVPAEKTLDA